MTQFEIDTLHALKRAAVSYTRKEIDWEQRRYDAAVSAMQGLLSNTRYHSCEECAERAIKMADTLIEKLKEPIAK